MKLPRDCSGQDLVKALIRLGYAIDHQTGSHIRITRRGPKEHHVTVPNHDPLKPGMLNAILRDVAENLGIDRESLLDQLLL